MKGHGNLSFWLVKEHKTDFMAVKNLRKHSDFVTYSYLKDSAFTAVKRDAKI